MVRLGRAASVAACLAAIAGAGPVWSGLQDRLAEGRLLAALAGIAPEVSVGAVARDPGTGRLVARDVRASGMGWSLSAARLTFTADASGGAFAADGPAVTADDLRLEGRRRVYRTSHVEIRGSALGPGDLAAILDPASATPAAHRWKRLTAATISASTVTIEPRADATSPRYAAVLHDLSLSGVAAGRIGTLAVRAIDVSGPDAPQRRLDIGAVHVDGLDLGLALSLDGFGDGSAALRPVLADASAVAIRYRDGEAALDIGSLRSGAVRARATSAAQRAALRLARLPRGSLDAVQRGALSDALGQVLVSFAYDHLEAEDSSFQGSPSADGRIRLGRLAVDDLGEGRSLSLLAERVAAEFSGTSVSLDRAAVAGYDQSAAAAMAETFVLEAAPQPGLDFGARGLWPSFTLEGLSISIPVESALGNDAARTHLAYTVSSLSVAGAGGPDGAIRSAAHMRLTMPTPDGAGQAPLASLVRLQPRIDAALAGAAILDTESGRLGIDGVSLRVADLGDLAFGAVLERISPELRRTKPDDPAFASEVAKVALRSLTLEFVDHGLAAKALPLLAAQARLTVPAFKERLKAQAAAALEEAAGPPTLTNAMTAAARTFIDDPRNIRLTLDAPAGLTVENGEASDSLAAFLGDAAVSVEADR